LWTDSYLVPERKLENFLKFKEEENSNRRNPDPIGISRIRIRV
jgi:hypothetical protein